MGLTASVQAITLSGNQGFMMSILKRFLLEDILHGRMGFHEDPQRAQRRGQDSLHPKAPLGLGCEGLKFRL